MLCHACLRVDAVRAAFPPIANLEQPLWDLVKEMVEIEQTLAGAARIPHCLPNCFPVGRLA